jgi:hypothetical protein
MALGYFSLLFWLFTAPNLRFGYGFLLALIVLAFAPLLQFALQRFSMQRSYLLTAIALVLLVQQVGVMLGSTRDDTRYTEYMILPADYARVPTDVCSLDGVDIFCARNYRQCSYKAFPACDKSPKMLN